MEMRLRPEQLALLGVLGLGVVILLLQLGQDWFLPDLGPDPPAPSDAAADPPQAGALPAAGSSAALGLRIDPVSPRLEEPLTVIAGLGGVEKASEVSFALVYDPAALSLSAGAHTPLTALGNETGEAPEISLGSPQPGRIEILLRRRGGDASLNATGDLCMLQFSLLKRGSAQLRIEQAAVRAGGEEKTEARGAELTFEVR